MRDCLSKAAGRDVSRETLERLECFAECLREEARRQNLISERTLESLWERHIIDSAQLVRFEPTPNASWIDIGSGAGLPGLVIACIVDGPVTLVEPRKLRGDFLARVAAELSLTVNVRICKAERVSGTYDVITGRAVAPLVRFLNMCDHLSTGKTHWVLPKGRSALSELADARRSWQGVFHVEQSITDSESRIVIGTGVRAKRA